MNMKTNAYQEVIGNHQLSEVIFSNISKWGLCCTIDRLSALTYGIIQEVKEVNSTKELTFHRDTNV